MSRSPRPATGHIYVIGSAVIIEPAQRTVLKRSAVEALQKGSPDRRRFHWTQLLPTTVRYEWIDKTDRLTWPADLVAAQ